MESERSSRDKTTKPDPEKMWQRLVVMGKGIIVEKGKASTIAWCRNAEERDKERKGRQRRP
jgi:hypothetical protein